MYQEPLSLSVLLTREDYMTYMAQKRRRMKEGHFSIWTAAGTVVSTLGMVGLFFGRRISLSTTASVCLVLLGIFLMVYETVVAPMLERARAAAAFEEKEELRSSAVYTITEEEIAVRSARLTGSFPLSCVTERLETPDLFGLSFGRELQIILPKRLLQESECSMLRKLLFPEKN